MIPKNKETGGMAFVDNREKVKQILTGLLFVKIALYAQSL